MTFKKRKKSSRYHGSQTHKRGHRKRTKGLGNKGGVGMSGSMNQKKSLIIKLYGMEYFGGDKTLRRGRVAPKLKTINLNDLIEQFDNLVKKGVAKMTPKGFEFNLKGYKVLGKGPLGAKISVMASAASKSAAAQIKEAGGSIVIEGLQTPQGESPQQKRGASQQESMEKEEKEDKGEVKKPQDKARPVKQEIKSK